MIKNQNVLGQLRERYPWPTKRPDFEPISWSLDGGGRWLVTEKIKRRDVKVVLEVGCFLGGSIQDWLNASNDVIVVAVDPWPETWDLVAYAKENGKCETIGTQLGRPEGFYQTFLANLWQHRDRVIPVREYSPAILHDLSSMGLKPDLIYLDSDKVGSEIQLCHELFPNALMTGDDWGWPDENGSFPIREPVQTFCEQQSKYLKVEGATWLIDDEPPTLRFRLRSFRRAVRRAMRERRKAKREQPQAA